MGADNNQSTVKVRLKVGDAEIDYEGTLNSGEVVGSTIEIGDENSEPLLGETASESVRKVDPRNQQLNPFLSAVERLQGLSDLTIPALSELLMS